MYAQLGSIKFELAYGFETYENSASASYAEHALIENKPRLQRTGNGLDEISFTLNLHLGFCNPDNEWERFLQAKDLGDVLPFVWGTGAVVGDFVITTLKRNIQKTDKDGFVIWSKVDITLREYTTPDKEAARLKQAQQNAFATSLRQPTSSPPMWADNPSQELMAAVGDSERDFSYMEGGVENYEADFLALDNLDEIVTKKTFSMESAMNKIETIHAAYNTIQAKAADLLVYVQDVKDAIATIQSLQPLTIDNISNLKTAFVTTRSGLQSVRAGSAGVAALAAGRFPIS